MNQSNSLSVLYLCNARRPFFQTQVNAVKRSGVSVDVIEVPGRYSENDDRIIRRTAYHYLRFIPKVIRNSLNSYDLIHANHGLTGPASNFQFSNPVVLTLWGSDLMGKFGSVSRFSAKCADKVILPSERMSEYINTDYELVPFGIDLQKFYPMSREKSREKISWSKKKSIVLFPYSKHRSVKNYDLAVDIVDSLDTPAELKSISEIPYSKMPIYINASDAVLITSKRESGPMVVKESAACNTPVVSVDVGFASEVLTKVSHSYVSDNKDELVKRLSQILDQKLRSDGRQYSQNWGMDRMGRQLTEIYSDIVD